MLYGDLNDYHPPEDVRAGEQFLTKIYNAVRTSPQWDQTALVVMFDEHGGCFDHVPPPAAVPPDSHPGEQDFAFDRLGVRVPFIVISPYTKRGTVVRDVHSNTSLTHTLQQVLGLGSPLTARVGAARTIEAAFNRSEPRRDMHQLDPLAFRMGEDNPDAQAERPGDLPSTTLWEQKSREAGSTNSSRIWANRRCTTQRSSSASTRPICRTTPTRLASGCTSVLCTTGGSRCTAVEGR